MNELREPKGWYCACGWPNGINLATCAQCNRSPGAPENQCAIIYTVKIDAVLAAMDEWLGNRDGLTIEDVIHWRDLLADALGVQHYGSAAYGAPNSDAVVAASADRDATDVEAAAAGARVIAEHRPLLERLAKT